MTQTGHVQPGSYFHTSVHALKLLSCMCAPVYLSLLHVHLLPVHLCTCLSASHDPGSDLSAVVHLPACPTCVNLPSNLPLLLDDIISPKRNYLSSPKMVSSLR